MSILLTWGNDLKLASLAGVALLVLVTLATSFPLLVDAQGRIEERSANMDDHMIFTRDSAQQGAEINALQDQQRAMAEVPAKLARLEERIDNQSRMIYAILGGILALLLKELWGSIQSIRARKPASL